MNRCKIFETLSRYDLDRDVCIIISGASLVVQGIIDETNDIDIATTTEYYQSLDWETKIGTLGKEIKYLDNIEISDNLYNPDEVVIINGYKFSNLKYNLKIKEMLHRASDEKTISELKKRLNENNI